MKQKNKQSPTTRKLERGKREKPPLDRGKIQKQAFRPTTRTAGTKLKRYRLKRGLKIKMKGGKRPANRDLGCLWLPTLRMSRKKGTKKMRLKREWGQNREFVGQRKRKESSG